MGGGGEEREREKSGLEIKERRWGVRRGGRGKGENVVKGDENTSVSRGISTDKSVRNRLRGRKKRRRIDGESNVGK